MNIGNLNEPRIKQIVKKNLMGYLQCSNIQQEVTLKCLLRIIGQPTCNAPFINIFSLSLVYCNGYFAVRNFIYKGYTYSLNYVRNKTCYPSTLRPCELVAL